MEKWKQFLVLAFSSLALGLSLYAVSNKCCADIPTTVLSLVGVCATLIVGVSIINAVEVNNIINKLEEKMDELTIRMNELSKTEEEMNKIKRKANNFFHMTWGLIFRDDDPYIALSEFWRAFYLSAKEDDVKLAKQCLKFAEKEVKRIKSSKRVEKEFNKKQKEKIPEIIPDDIKESNVYIAFKDRVDSLLEDIHKNI